jgi:hypothetical protein
LFSYIGRYTIVLDYNNPEKQVHLKNLTAKMQVDIDVKLFLYMEATITSVVFLLSLLIGLRMHYVDVVKNHVASYPDEWFPSVSAILGDYYPARNIIQFGIALAAMPRFVNICIRAQQLFDDDSLLVSQNIPFILIVKIYSIVCDILRTLAIGGFVYITSNDNALLHTSCMIFYIITQIAYMKFQTHHMNNGNVKPCILILYIFTLCIMSVFLYEHYYENIPGSYSKYAIFEWTLIVQHIFFDHGKNNMHDYDMFTTYNEFSDIWSSVVFWTNLTVMPLMLWYFPLWNMGLSGYEIGLIAYFAPVIAPILLQTNSFTTFTNNLLHILSGLVFISAFISNVQLRFVIVCIATGASMLQMFIQLRYKPLETGRTLYLGLLCHLAFKLINDSISCFWTIDKNRLHATGIFVCIHIFAIVPKMLNLFQSRLSENRIAINAQNSTITLSIARGAAWFLMHKLFTDIESINMLKYDFMSAGQQFRTFGFMVFCVIVMMECSFIGGLTLAGLYETVTRKLWIFINLSTYFIVSSGEALHSFKHILILISTYVLFLLSDVWTVAYAFVPAGNYLREQSTLVLAIAIAFIAIGIYEENNAHSYILIQTFPKRSLNFIYFLLFTVSISTMIKMNIEDNQEKLVKIRDPNVLTVGIWTVHFGLDNKGFLSHRNMSQLIKKLDLDVIGLLESDTMRIIGGNRNMLTYIARKNHMYSIYGPRPNQHTWGCSLLSKYPIVNYTTHLLPSPNGELACAIHATLRMRSGKLVDIITSHNGQEEDLTDRLLQTQTIADIATEIRHPVIFIGYLVTKPGIGNVIYDIMIEKAQMKDIYPTDQMRWCQYIFYRDIYPLAYARVSHGQLTDTEIQTAKFWIGGNDTIINLTAGVNGNMYPTDLINQDWNGHQYHVYSEPIYDPLNNIVT